MNAKLLAQAPLLALFSQLGRSEEQPTLTGLSLYESSDIGVIQSSMAGGGSFIIKGYGFDMDPSDNKVIFETSDLSTSTQWLEGPPLSLDDQFKSSPPNGILAYTTPSLTDLVPGTTFEDYKPFSSVATYVKVQTASGKTLTCANANNCKVNFNWDYTPRFQFMAPPDLYYGAEAAALLTPKNAVNFKLDGQMPVDYRIDGTTPMLNEAVYNVDTNISKNKQLLRGTVQSELPNKHAQVLTRFRGAGDYAPEPSATHCSWDGTDCYTARLLPSIHEISTSTGFTSGGQTLRLTGYGLLDENVSVMVDGVPCEIKTNTNKEITCVTGPKPENPGFVAPTRYVGQQGVHKSHLGESTLLTQLEMPASYDDHYEDYLTGFFVAPADGDYQFHMTCDDHCKFSMSLTDPTDPAAAELLIDNEGVWTSFRNFMFRDKVLDIGTIFSEWVTLTKGTKYYYSTWLKEGSGNDHVSVGVEIATTTPHSYPKVTNQVMSIGATQTLIREEIQFKLTGADDLFYVLMYQDINNVENFVASSSIVAGCNADQFKNAIKHYYTERFQVEPEVTRTCQDASQVEVDCGEDTVQDYLYNVVLPKSIEGQSVENIIFVSQNTSAIVEWSLVQTSSKPLNGRYQIRCFNELGQYADTEEMDFNTNNENVWWKLTAACPFLNGKLDVIEDVRCQFKADCIDFKLFFSGMEQNLPLFEMLNSTTYGLTGNEDAQPTFYVEETETFGPNAWFDVIPFEFLYTAHETPQVIVTIGDMPAVCAHAECNYEYLTPGSLITGVDVVGQSVTITGVDLPIESSNVTMGNVQCSVSSVSDTEIQCTVDTPWVAGQWLPKILTDQGLIPVDELLVNKHTVTPTVSSISPALLNPAGGELVTITGTGFPTGLDTDDDVVIGFSDRTSCKVIASTPTELTCRTDQFATAGRLLQGRVLATIDLLIDVNGESVSLSTSTDSNANQVTAITPSRLSPIKIQTIEIQLNTDYPEAGFDTEEFNVKLVQRELGNVNDLLVIKDERPLRVVARDSVAKTITVKYGGAYSGTYDVVVTNTAFGIFCDLQLEVILEVTDFSPKTGSQFGGTLLSIQGGPFDNEITDNIIKIGYEYMSGTNHYCTVVETQENEIKCRQAVDFGRQTGSTTLIVFASTYEEGVCNVVDGCQFEFVDVNTLATLLSATAAWDPASQSHKITITGMGFEPLDQAKMAVIIGGIEQNILSVTPTEIIAEVTAVNSGTVADQLEVYLAEGVVNGFNALLAGVTFEPALVDLSVNEASSAGGVIRASVKGAGVNDKLTLVLDDSLTSICETATMVEYGVLECVTMSQDYVATVLKVRDTEAGITYDCMAADPAQCTFQTYASESQPTIDSYDLTSSTQITVFGTALSPVDYTTCALEIAGVQADNCSIVSAGSVTADFNMGVPSVQEETLGKLTFTHMDGVSQQTATNPSLPTLDDDGFPVQVGIILPLDVTGQTVGQSCSFNGGCLHEITSQGLASKIKSGLASVNFCSKPCTLREDLSDASKAVCELSPIQNKASVDLFEITPLGPIHGTVTVSNPNMKGIATDGVNFPTMDNTGVSCWIKFTYPDGYMGDAEMFKFFMDYFPDSSLYDGHLHFQGSNDDFTADINTLVTVGIDIHEGWNYFDLTDSNGINPKYQAYRLYNAQNGGCDKIGEIEVYGSEVIDSTATTETCEPEIVYDDELSFTISSPEFVSYDIALTPVLTNISPKWGSVTGGEEVTFTGEWPSVATSDVTVTIDDLPCAVSAISATELTCTTSPRIGYGSGTSSLVIFINGFGNAATQGQTFTYVSKWSEPSTWGGQFAPVDGESVAVHKGLNLLVDIDASPILNAVIIDGGSLIFPSDNDPNHQRTFDANLIYVQHGFIQAGTEEEPYTSKLTITMHGNKYDPYIPIYGNKCIGVRYATLDLHGVPRDVTWTNLEATVEAGATQISLIESVDWQVGEEIVITSTDFDKDHAETRFITAIIPGAKPLITLDEPLSFKHYAAVDNYGASDFIEIRAEVGLLTRNVVYRGDPETSPDNQYGSHIMVASPGDETSIGRISYVELTNVGQAFQMGRYPIHFHMIGRVHKSFIRGNSIHTSFNRGTTIHGVQYLRLEENVYYDTMGHTVFVEDAAETKNYIYKNLVINVKPSFSLLNTDSTPACFWITHPDNIFVGNVAAGSERYGFWFDLQSTAIGPSFNPNICPTRSKLGEFRDNVAHSVKHYGLRIFHGHDPHERPCAGNVFDQEKYYAGENPYEGNNPITAVYENFLGYKNGRNGVMSEDMGAVVFKNIKTADNGLAGVEVNKVISVWDNMARLEDAVLVGQTTNNAEATGSPHGIIAPQRDGWRAVNVRFYNYDFNNAAALGSCSHCFSEPATDSGARETKFENLQFDDLTVPRRIRYQAPFKAIFHDLDGTLTGAGPGTWATAFWQHNAAQPECTTDMDKYDGLICDSTVQVRRLIFYGAEPGSLNRKDLYIVPFDDSIIKPMDNVTYDEYMADESNYGIIPWRKKKNPVHHWAVPFVTGHKYYVRWEHGLDFEEMTLERIPWLWDQSDLNIELVFPHYDVREAVEIKDNTGYIHPNNTIGDESNRPFLSIGDNVVYNQTDVREINLIINGKNETISKFVMTGIRCIGDCVEEIADDVEEEIKERYWSQPRHWNYVDDNGLKVEGAVPVEGDEVIIREGWNMIYDIEESPKLKSVEVRGNLTFLNDNIDRHIQVYNFWVRSGTLNIGSLEEPFLAKAYITLFGDNTEEYFAFQRSIEAGNKNLVVTGTANIYGQPRDKATRLQKTLLKGGKVTRVETGLDWVAGERIVIAPTNMRTMDTDMATIESYDPFTGDLVLVDEVKGYHFGARASTFEDYGVDMRAEVAMMDRNVKIDASTDDINNILKESWGCRILVSDFFEPNLVRRTGSLNMDHVQVYNCSQKFTWKAAIKFQNAVGASSRVSNCAFHEGRGLGAHIVNSANIDLTGNVFADFVERGVWAQNSKKLIINDNWVFNIPLTLKLPPTFMKFEGETGCFTVSEKVSKVTMHNNIAAGCWHHGFHFIPQKCDDTDPDYSFINNVAHTISGYGAIALLVEHQCTEVKDMVGYKITEASIMLGGHSKQNIGTNLRSIDSRYGIAVHPSTGTSLLRDSYSYSELRDNVDCPDGNDMCEVCIDRIGVIPPISSDTGHFDRKPKYSKFPLWENGGLTGFGTIEDHTFVGFNNPTTTCGSRQRAIAPYISPNYTPFANIIRPRFFDLNPQALTFMPDPEPDWANPSDCVEFPCTGPVNVVIRLENASFKSGRRLEDKNDDHRRQLQSLPSTFTMAANNVNYGVSTEVIPECEYQETWNAYLCKDDNIGVLIFDSLDDDTMDRSVQPIYVQNLEHGFNNKLNSYMDDCWDGFYTCQKRLSRFPTMIYQGWEEYNLEYTGTPPEKQKFLLKGKTTSNGILVSINYPNAASYQLYDEDGNEIMPTDWDEEEGTWAKPTGKYCGEWRYEGVINRLQFWINPNTCTITVKPRDAIMLAIRMEFGLDEFFASGGIATFTDRMAATLGIHKADLKIVSVYEGSTVVEFMVISDKETQTVPVDLEKVQKTYDTFVQRNPTFMGSKILSAIMNGEPIFGDPFGDHDGNGYADLIDKFQEELENQQKRQEMIERNKKRAENLMNQVSQEAKHGGVVTEESQSIFENVELVKYLFAVLILILVLIISVIALCIARICLKEKTEEQIRRIHKSLKDEHGTVQTQSGMVKAEDTSRNTEPLEEITQYQPKNLDIDNIVKSARNMKQVMNNSQRARPPQMDHLRVNSRQIVPMSTASDSGNNSNSPHSGGRMSSIQTSEGKLSPRPTPAANDLGHSLKKKTTKQ